MKKKIAILLLLFSAMTIGAQEMGSIKLSWENTSVSTDKKSFQVIAFEKENFLFEGANKTIQYRENILSPNYNFYELISYKAEIINEKDLLDIEFSNLKQEIDFKSEVFLARNDQFISLSFNPIFIENGVIKKVTSVDFIKKNIPNTNQNRTFNTQNITNSVLASGDFYKFYVTKSGVYKISKGFLESIGFNVNVNPQNIKIYGNGGRMAPLLNSIPYPNDLEENAIQIIGEEDGRFDSQDYILFFAEGFDNWNTESLTHLNLYADKSYYYISASGNPGKRIVENSQPTENSTLLFTTFDDYQFYEKDEVNIGKLGRKWFGNSFAIEDDQEFEFSLPNLVTSEPISLFVNMASASQGNSSFEVFANQQSLGTVSFTSLASLNDAYGVENFLNTTINSTSPNLKIRLKYNNGGVPSSNGVLDFISIRAKRNLAGFGNQFRFKNNLQSTNIGVGEYTISNASNIGQVWDITDIYNVTKYSNNSGSNFSFKVNLGEDRSYIAVDNSNFLTPEKVSIAKVSNQDLKGTIFNNNQGNFQDIDYLIITPGFLYNQAETLAKFHRDYNSHNVKVVTLENIYEEFSSGKKDIGAIRNFIKYVYFNASTPEKRVKYVNLFGDTSFDYQDRIPNNNDIVPTFHYLNLGLNNPNNFFNFHTISCYMSDDFFGLMDENEGNMTSVADGIDIAVGRMIVSTPEQAQEIVAKTTYYFTENCYDRWRNSYVIMSDDADTSTDAGLQVTLNNMIDNLNEVHPTINVKKIHTDSYIQEVSAGGERYPKANKDFLDAIRLGALVLNYYGHGGEDGFARERLFESDDAFELRNINNLPLLITMTCDYSRFDNPYKKTGGEFVYWNKNGGAVALVSTTRSIYIHVASQMNVLFNNYLYQPNYSEQFSIAEALRRTKVLTNDVNRRVVSCIGDPAFMLAIPKPKVILTKINGVNVNETTDVLNALSLVTLSGEVVDQNNATIINYNGDLAIQIFDKPIQRETLANNGVSNTSGLIKMQFETLGETIFRGNASVVNGKFEFSFVVPRDIKMPIGTGKVSFYAKTKIPNLQDQTGHDFSVKIGGLNTNAPVDTTAPTVKLYMNDTNFVYGGITNESPIFLAYLEDENGINTASGIGHDIIAVLDGDENNPYILNDYYETENDNFRKGIVTFPFANLAPGLHTITFKAWDVYNNLITAEIQFIVIGDENLKLEHVLNYPNPFVSYTEFWFNHNRPFENLDVQVQIFTVTGKIVKTINQTINSDGFLSRELKWDGRDDFGDKIGKGVYVYKLTVKSTIDGKKTEKYEKLVIL